MFTLPNTAPASAGVLVTDLHLHHLPKHRLKWCEDFIDALLAVGPGGPLKKVPLFLMGDALELRDNLDSRVANLFLKLCLSWEGGVYWLAGQHDSYVPGIATFRELRQSPGIVVVDEAPCETDSGLWLIPYARDSRVYASWLDVPPDGATVLTHYPVVEALRRFDKTAKGISVKRFRRFTQTYSGDIHKAQEFPRSRFAYVGATSQRDFRDAGMEGCFGLLMPDGSLRRVPVQGPEFIRVESAAELRKLQQRDWAYPPTFLLAFDSVTDEQVAELRQGGAEVRVDPGTVVHNVVEQMSIKAAGKTDEQLLSEYLDGVADLGNLKRKDVLAVGLRALAEAQE